MTKRADIMEQDEDYKRCHTSSGGGKSQYWLTRVVFLRCLGFIYFVAFLVALNDNGSLLGEDGLLPATRYMSRVKLHLAQLTTKEKLSTIPTIFWFVEPNEANLWWTAAAGASISALLALRGATNSCVLLVLWVLYHSLVNVGQTFYSYGWESQLLETGFLAVFLVPWFSLSRYPAGVPAPLVCVWSYRWLLFRIMLGAGLIKMRGDECWMDLTCTDYHYQTQPNPNPLSLYMHHALPHVWHKSDVVINHIVELVIPCGLLLPRSIRCFSGSIQIAFQVALIISGNLSFLNWLTLLPAIFSYDDGHWRVWFNAKNCRLARRAHMSTLTATAPRQAPPLSTGERDGSKSINETKGNGGGVGDTCGRGGGLKKGKAEVGGKRSGKRQKSSRNDRSDQRTGDKKEADGRIATQGKSKRISKGHRHREQGEGNASEPPHAYESGGRERHEHKATERVGGAVISWRTFVGRPVRFVTNGALLFLVVKKSIPVVKNMVRPDGRQLMNSSFDSFRIVNTYGAFGTITKERHEIVLKGTRHDDPFDPASEWQEYEFKCKPGKIDTRPCVITPYHYRLDWQMWFAAFQNYNTNPWLVNLAAKLLSPDRATRSRAGALLRNDPFDEGDGSESEPPKFIKADLYLYEFTKPDWLKPLEDAVEQGGANHENVKIYHGKTSSASSSGGLENGAEVGKWWTRRYVKEYMPALSTDNYTMRRYLGSYGLG